MDFRVNPLKKGVIYIRVCSVGMMENKGSIKNKWKKMCFLYMYLVEGMEKKKDRKWIYISLFSWEENIYIYIYITITP